MSRATNSFILAMVSLLSMGCSTNALMTSNSGASDPFQLLTQDPDTKQLESALLDQSDPTLSDSNGRTILHQAARHSSKPDVIKFLHNRYVDDIDTQDNHGQTPLMESLLADRTPAYLPNGLSVHPDVVIELLDQGANPDHQNRRKDLNLHGQTPLHFAAGFSNQPKLVLELIERGANINHQDSRGFTALHYSVWYGGNPQMVQFLLDQGADPSVRDRDGETALALAARNASPEVIQTLLDHGANPRVRNYNGNTPLELMIWNNREASQAPVFEEIRKITLATDREDGFQPPNEDELPERPPNARSDSDEKTDQSTDPQPTDEQSSEEPSEPEENEEEPNPYQGFP